MSSSYYWRFGNVILPDAQPDSDIGTGQTRSTSTPIIGGGGYDAWGTRIATISSRTFQHRAYITGTDGEELKTKIDGLKSLVGKRDKLYRREADGEVHWCYARVLSVMTYHRAGYLHHQEVVISFEQADYPWNGLRHGTGWIFDGGEFFDTGLSFDEEIDDVFYLTSGTTLMDVINAGNQTVKDAKFTILASGSNITGFSMVHVGEGGTSHLVFNGTIPSGEILIIDCGARTVLTEAGSSLYQHLSRSTLHNVPGWLEIDPGTNEIQVIRTGGGGSSMIWWQYMDGWA